MNKNLVAKSLEGKKVQEVLVSEEEIWRAREQELLALRGSDGWFKKRQPACPELWEV